MGSEVQRLREFYRSPAGVLAAAMLRHRLAELWPDCTGQEVLGLGYPLPYLRRIRAQASRCIAVFPAQHGALRWPSGSPGLALSAEEDALPFADLSFDRVLVVHGLEAAENTRRMLREAWRVLRENGRLIIAAPNRRGMWAHLETTPFGQGQPYSAGQLTRLLEGQMFKVERREAVLFAPPVGTRLSRRIAPALERGGRMLCPRFCGVVMVEARKDVLAVIPASRGPLRKRVFAGAACETTPEPAAK